MNFAAAAVPVKRIEPDLAGERFNDANADGSKWDDANDCATVSFELLQNDDDVLLAPDDGSSFNDFLWKNLIKTY